MSAAEGLEQRLRSILDAARGTVTRLASRLRWRWAWRSRSCPAELHYGVARSETVQGPEPVTISDQGDAAASEASWAGCEPPVELPAYGCPTFPPAEGD